MKRLIRQLEEASGQDMTQEEFLLLVKGMLKKEFGGAVQFKTDFKGDTKYVSLRMSEHEQIGNPEWHPEYDVPVTVEFTVYSDGKNVGVALMGHYDWSDEVSFRAQKLDKRRAQGVVKKARKMWNKYDKELNQHRADEYEAEQRREYGREIADTERAYGRRW